MANVVVKIVGGDPKNVSAQTVGEAKRILGVPTYQASVNGLPADDGKALSDDEFITLSPSVKGG